MTTALEPHDLLPMFTVADLASGGTVDYRELWQRKTLLLVSVRADDTSSGKYVESLMAEASMLRENDTAIVVTREAVAGVPHPGVVVADRWGEIHYVTGADASGALPGAAELTEWLR